MAEEFVNKFKQYKTEKGLRWFDLQTMTGISQVTLQKIYRANSFDEMKWVSLGTYQKLKEKLGLDLLN